MAFAVLGPGKGIALLPEVARRLQDIKDGKITGLPHEQEKAAQIQRIYFADHHEQPAVKRSVTKVIKQTRLPYKD